MLADFLSVLAILLSCPIVTVLKDLWSQRTFADRQREPRIKTPRCRFQHSTSYIVRRRNRWLADNATISQPPQGLELIGGNAITITQVSDSCIRAWAQLYYCIRQLGYAYDSLHISDGGVLCLYRRSRSPSVIQIVHRIIPLNPRPSRNSRQPLVTSESDSIGKAYRRLTPSAPITF